MRSGEPRAVLDLEQATVAALDLLGRARGALAQGELVELGRLMTMLEALRGQLGRLSATDDRHLRRGLLALLDEAGALAEKLARQRAHVAAQLREAGDHRRAGAAYRRASRL